MKATSLFPENEMTSSPYSLFADVALGVPQEEPYQYGVPMEFKEQIAIGKRVRVPLRSQTRIGYVVGISKTASLKNIKPIAEVLDSEGPFLTEKFRKLTHWMSEYYFCSWGQAIEAVMPTPFKKGKTVMKSRSPKNTEESLVHATPVHSLTAQQSQVYESIWLTLKKHQFKKFLLHGITGSGKTEIYLCLIEKLIQEERGSIVLVPEISLTPQTTQRFKARFGDLVAVVHSRISTGKRLEEWHRLRKGEAKVVVGARSAVFSPVKDLGIIVIDEQHDDSYKQEETPRYEAGRVAEERCRIEGAVLLSASATPSLESYFEAKKAEGELLTLSERIEQRPLPQVTILDMRNERRGRTIRLFSIKLEDAIQKALDKKEQVMLLMNRRGFAPFVSCMTCGTPVGCPRCRVSMVFHHDLQKLLCHTCHYMKFPPKMCPACNKGYVRYMGIGTEKVESEAARLFPQARIARMDRDATSRKDAHEKLLERFRRREVDILLGTQMIAKGHDFPAVSVIGVISADTALNLPDFRSAERAFSLLTQVAGRAGRKDIPGRVFIQTFLPTHYAIQAAKDHDYHEFYAKEIRFREQLKMPPYQKLIQIILQGRVEKDVLKRALEFRKKLEEKSKSRGLEIMGPAPCLVSKRYGQYLWNLYLKVGDLLKANIWLKEELQSFGRQGVKITVDVNPR